ncbi:glycosyltransferase family 2 protein [Clostridium aestuarii]|uniref:Glycosyltransferase family 2 protein n=1 Tax=Clostridium aestuarii TaxID=338193 RepID=A0ABT4D090_9CLOT|nr:glycosyltransferase family 2 protein [Clostridium aestuarii]MCY6484512.1 glycosyltransferase family 2 protein [Clostridium aestuarii]
MHELSLIIPCYNEEQALPFLYKAICEVTDIMSEQKFEFIFVNDGSEDKTLDIIKNLSVKDKRIRYISFSRNFGKEAAMYAGLEAANGDFMVIMDADMQDPPNLLPEMYGYVKKGEYDSVATRRVTREGEPPIRSFFAKQFYKIINKISSLDIVDGARDFRLMSCQMAEAILSMKEYNRFSKGIYGWVGFKTKWLPFKNIERVAGETKWSFWKLFLYSLEGIVGFSTTPLAIASILGLIFCIVSFSFIVYIIVKTIIFNNPVAGWPSLACIILFISGIQLFCMGIIGQYLSKTYLETKGRPIYIIKETERMNSSKKMKRKKYIKSI